MDPALQHLSTSVPEITWLSHYVINIYVFVVVIVVSCYVQHSNTLSKLCAVVVLWNLIM